MRTRVLVVTTLACISCAPTDAPQPEAVGRVSAAVSGGIKHTPDTPAGNQCTPFELAVYDRAARIGRTVSSGDGFRTCFENTMRDRYMACGDSAESGLGLGPSRPAVSTPGSEADMDVRVERAFRLVGLLNNRMDQRCFPGTSKPGVNAPLGTFAHPGDAAVNFDGGAIHESKTAWTSGEWGATGVPSRDMEPWKWWGGTVGHEFAHSHGYIHPGFGCSKPTMALGSGVTYPIDFPSNRRRFRLRFGLGGPFTTIVFNTGTNSLANIVSTINAATGRTPPVASTAGTPPQLKLSADHASERLMVIDGPGPPGALAILGMTGGIINEGPECGSAQCSWTSACDGSGTPPHTTLPPSQSDWDFFGEFSGRLEFCTWVNTEGSADDLKTYYGLDVGDRLEPSVPYMISDCSTAVVETSQQICGRVLDNPTCGDGEVMLVATWNGRSQDAQSGTPNDCVCVPDPRNVVYLVGAQNGGMLTAPNGGGSSTIQTTITQRIGPWQMFAAIDPNLPSLTGPTGDALGWSYGDPVELKTNSGHWVDPTFKPDDIRYPQSPDGAFVGFFFDSPDGATGRIVSGADVVLRTGHLGLPSYAYDDGTNLQPGGNPGDVSTKFTVYRYRREHMVYLQSPHSVVDVGWDPHVLCPMAPADCPTYVAYDDVFNGFHTALTDLTLANTSLDGQLAAQKRRAAFWLIDWNGGALIDGDEVSFESPLNAHFLSTAVPTPDDALVRLHSVGTAGRETFQLGKLGGSSGNIIRHDDVVSMRSSSGNYVSVWASGTADTGRVNDSGTSVGNDEMFTLRMVHYHDQDRPTWDGAFDSNE
jgi:hypothetical protein